MQVNEFDPDLLEKYYVGQQTTAKISSSYGLGYPDKFLVSRHVGLIR